VGQVKFPKYAAMVVVPMVVVEIVVASAQKV
jgi:hypothetical protein